MENKIKIKVFNNSRFPLPKQQTSGSSGFDLRADIKEEVELKPNEAKLIPTGIYLEIPYGYEGQVRARSGLSSKHGITLANGIGTIDSDYRGEVKVILINLFSKSYTIKPGERLAQIVFVPIVIPDLIEVDNLEDLEETDRSGMGFGHTGN